MAVSRDGRFLYVAALGSSKLGVFRTSELEGGAFVPSREQQVRLTGGGPTGLVLDEDVGVAYVMTRFDNGISTVDLARKREIAVGFPMTQFIDRDGKTAYIHTGPYTSEDQLTEDIERYLR